MVFYIKLAFISVETIVPPLTDHQVACVMYYFMFSICFESLCTFLKTFSHGFHMLFHFVLFLYLEVYTSSHRNAI